MLNMLKTKIASSSKYVRWFWWALLGLVMGGALLALFLRRRAVLERLGQLRVQLAETNRQLLDAKTVAETARHDQVIARHHEAVEALQDQASLLEQQIKQAQADHSVILGEIDAAQDWTELEKLRQQGNARVGQR